MRFEIRRSNTCYHQVSVHDNIFHTKTMQKKLGNTDLSKLFTGIGRDILTSDHGTLHAFEVCLS